MKYSIFNFKFSINLLLICIILLFLFTRLYKIGQIPPSVYWDEASIGYNAYSIVQTSKDEWGDFLPIHFRAFWEFKLPVYIYSVVPFIKIFGLNEFSVRLPAVLFSLGTVILTYLLAKKLMENEIIGLLSALFTTTIPWLFIISRTGFEATAGLMFYLLGVYLSLRINENRWFTFFSIISFILSAYSYNGFRVIFLLTILILLIFESRSLIRQFKAILFPLILSLIFLVASLWLIFRLYAYDAGLFRLHAIGDIPATAIIGNFASHFSLDFLFGGDKNLQFQQENYGQIYFPQFIFLLIGILFMIGSKSKHLLLPIFLLLIGPIPSAITNESPHALRSISMAPFISMISASGVVHLAKLVKLKKVFYTAIIVMFLAAFLSYLLNFIRVYSFESSKNWQYGYKKIYTDFSDKFKDYDKIIISDSYAQPYIFALFYLRYDPEKFQNEVVRNSVDQLGFSSVVKFDKFEFGKVEKLLEGKKGKSLIFASSQEKFEDANPIGSIIFLDGSNAFWVYEQNN